MIKFLAILQIFTILTSSAGVNIFKHYCNKTHTVTVALTKDAATCIGHNCCHTGHNHSQAVKCCHTEQTANNKTADDFEISSVEYCKDISDYFFVANETPVGKTIDFDKTPVVSIVDFDIPLIVNESMPRKIDYVNHHLHIHKLSRSLISYIYYASEIA